jgi:tetraacyldisaccharide 4'-kinase
MNHARLYDIMSDNAHDPAAAATRLGLSAFAPAYRLAVALRNKQFDAGLRKPAKLPRPVISVGNLTTGGTGKTPKVIELARRLLNQNQKPAVLLRGYMKEGATASSDEAVELQRELGSAVAVMPNPDRAEGARQVLEKHPDVTVFLLDDGFQHRQVHRDLDIVLIDATRPFGFERLLPRGLLREPAKNLRRAHAVILTRCDLVPPAELAALDRRIESLTGKPPTAHAAQYWSGYRKTVSDTVLPADHLKNLKVTAATAIGNPTAFNRMLQAVAGELLHTHTFDDHHAYTLEEVQHLLADAKQRGVDAVVVTEKDWVKWRGLMAKLDVSKDTPPIIRPVLGVRFTTGEANIQPLLKAGAATR